jgi:hypothetical protein
VKAWLLRFAGVLVLVLVTWNPEGHSFVHWVGEFEGEVTSPFALTGVVLTIAWVVVFVTSWKSLGVIGTGLLAALIGTALWAAFDWVGATLSGRAISYVVLVAIALALSIAMSWKAFTRRFSRTPPGSA